MQKQKKIPPNPKEKVLLPIQPHELPNGSQFHKRYSDEMKLAAISYRAMGHSYKRISRAFGIGLATAYEWCNSVKHETLVELGISDLAETLKKNYASKLILSNSTLLSHEMKDANLKKMNSFQLNIMRKNNYEQIRLASGESTENVNLLSRRVIDMKDAKTKIRDQIQANEAEEAAIEAKIREL